MAWETGETKTWTLNHTELSGINQRQCICEIQGAIDSVDRLVGHNLKFDLQWLWKVGIKTDHLKLYCTQVAEYLIQGQRKIPYSLAETSLRYGITPKIDRVKIFWDAGYETDEVPLRILDPYLQQDCINTLVIYQRQVPAIREWQMGRLVALQMELMGMLAEMEMAGARVDVAKATALHASLVEQISVLEQEIRLALGRDDLNINSGDELSAALYGGKIKRDYEEQYTTTRKATRRESFIFHYKDPKKPPIVKYRNVPCEEEVVKTRRAVEEIELPRIFQPIKGTGVQKEGYYKTDKNTLKQLPGKTKEQRRILELLEEHSKVFKAAETFLGAKEDSGILGKVVEGMVHPSFNQTIAATGRLTSSNPKPLGL